MPTTLFKTAEWLLKCVEQALEDSLRPVCRSYQTVGTPVIASCCECSDGENGELSIHFRRMFDADANTLSEVQRIYPCHGGVVAAQFRLVLARCFPTINERGELPTPEFLTDAADDLADDSNIMWRSLSCCPDFPVRIDDLSVDLGPSGGCSIVYVDVTTRILVPAIVADQPIPQS